MDGLAAEVVREDPFGPASILIVEDSRVDQRVLCNLLEKSALIRADLACEESLAGALQAIAAEPPDLILLDLNLGDSGGLDTLRQVHAVAESIPIVIITGQEDELLGLKALRLGAQDWLPKRQVHVGILPRMVLHAFERKRIKTRLTATVAELTAAMNKVKKLESLIPVCAACHKVREDDGYWIQVEAYLTQRTHLKFSHGICPGCLRERYPDCEDVLMDDPT